MPSTINGVGTTYFGKKNKESYAGVCESCGASTTLSDYETGHFICVVFIPLIPLGRKMILGECPSCTRHRVMPLREWERAKEESVSEGVQSLSENSEDPTKAIELLGTFTAFKQYDQAKALAGATAKTHPDDYDTQLALGGWYESMDMKEEGDACFDRCLELDFDCDHSKRIRCIEHIQKKEFDPAKSLAWELYESNPDDSLVLLFVLANAYSDDGQNQDAYEIHERLVQEIPELKDDGEFCTIVRKLETELAVQDSIVPKKKWFGLFG